MNVKFAIIALAACATLQIRPASATFLAFTPDPARAGAAPAVACAPEPGLALGALTASAAGVPCHAGGWGAGNADALSGNTSVDSPSTALFSTAALRGNLHLGGVATISFAHRTADTYTGVPATYQAPRFSYALVDIDASGGEATIVEGTGALATSAEAVVKRSAVQFGVPAYAVVSGHRFGVRLTSENQPDTLIYFGGEFSDSGIALETGGGDVGSGDVGGVPGAGGGTTGAVLGGSNDDSGAPAAEGEGGGGAMSPALLLTLCARLMRRRRRRT